MKSRCVIISALLGIVSIATAQTVITLGTFGFAKVDKPAGTLNLIGVGFGDAETGLNDVAPVEQFNGSVFFSGADRVIVWDSGSLIYSTYALFDDSAYNSPATIEWRDAGDFTGSAVNPVIPVGSGFWIQSSGSSVNTDFIVSGNVVDSQFVTNQIVVNLQMLAYPFSTDVDLNATQLKDNATGSVFFADADRVITWSAATQSYSTYALFDDSAYNSPATVEWRDAGSFTSPAGPILVNLGEGFWYEAKSGFSWVETNKYYSSL